MDMPVNQFKRALREGRKIFGAWLTSGAPSTAEALGCAGFDFLVVDMEHTPVDTPEMVEILRTIAGTPAQAVVRLLWNDMVWVKRVLDGGAQTLLLPFVQNADEAQARRRLHALSARRHPRRRRRASRQPLRHRARLSQDRGAGNLRDGADRDAAGAEQLAADRRGARRRLDIHRPVRPRGVDGLPGRHRQPRRAGQVEGRRRAMPASSASPAASSA